MYSNLKIGISVSSDITNYIFCDTYVHLKAHSTFRIKLHIAVIMTYFITLSFGGLSVF